MTPIVPNSRREFLRNSLPGGAAALAAWQLPAPPRARAAPASAAPASSGLRSRVALTTGNDRADLAFKALEPFKKEIAAAIGRKHIILKPNNVHIDRPLCASHADNLEGILEFLKSIRKTKVTIAESPSGGSALEGFANYGYDKVAAKYGAKLADLDNEGFETLYCIDQKDLRPRPCRVSKVLLDPGNFVISAAKFKTHMLV